MPIVALLIAGAREASAFGLPAGADCLTLPCLAKDEGGRYHSRRLDMALEELVFLRSSAIAAALEAFAPDVLIVDKVPRGAVRELDPSLRWLQASGRTRCVLGLRDVLDDPATVCREWSEAANEEAIAAYYDAIWVYGDTAVYNPVREYDFPPHVAAKVRFTGYLARTNPLRFSDIDGVELLPSLSQPVERLVLCLVGGGQDGAQLAETFAQADFPAGTTGVILTGPFMPPEVQAGLLRRASGKPQLRILKFVADADLLLSRADRVVAMGGYNTVCELLSYAKPALIVPRVKPRVEQLIRAQHLRDLGLLDLLHPEDLTPRRLSEWLARDLKPASGACDRIHLDGLATLIPLLEEVLSLILAGGVKGAGNADLASGMDGTT